MPSWIINRGSVQGTRSDESAVCQVKLRPLYHTIIGVSLSWSLRHSSAPPSFLPSSLPPLPSSYHKFEVVNVSIKTGGSVLFHRRERLMLWYKKPFEICLFCRCVAPLLPSPAGMLWAPLIFCGCEWKRGGKNATGVCKSGDDVTRGWRRVQSAESSSGACRRGGLIKREQRMSQIQRPGGWSGMGPSKTWKNKPKRLTFGFEHIVHSCRLAVLTFESGRRSEM